MGTDLYNNGAKITPSTDYNSVMNGSTTLEQDMNAIGSLVHSSVIEEFSVNVNYEKPITDTQLADEVSSFKEYTTYSHSCYFSAPGSDNKTKFVIIFPGGGMTAASGFAYMNVGKILNSLGYAVLVITGYSQEYMSSKGVTSNAAPVGSWYATEEVIKAYKYLTEKYKWIDTEGCYFYGESQGGMIAENVADSGTIPLKASALDAPAVSMEHVQMSLRMASVTAVYGIESGAFDKTKCIGCDPWTRNVSEEISTTLANVTAKKWRNTNSPLLIIGGTNDSYVSPTVVKCYVKALMNAGNWVEYRAYNNLTSPYHGVVQYSPICGKVGAIDVTQGFVDVLNFFKRNGGYDFTLTAE